jgi:hypothetical protein
MTPIFYEQRLPAARSMNLVIVLGEVTVHAHEFSAVLFNPEFFSDKLDYFLFYYSKFFSMAAVYRELVPKRYKFAFQMHYFAAVVVKDNESGRYLDKVAVGFPNFQPRMVFKVVVFAK